MSRRDDHRSRLGGEKLRQVFLVSKESDFPGACRVESGHAGKQRTRLTADDFTIDAVGEFRKTQAGCQSGRVLGLLLYGSGSFFGGGISLSGSVLVKVFKETGSDVGGVLGVEKKRNLRGA